MNDIDYINQMIFNVCNAYSIDVKDLNKKCNENCYVMPRYVIIFLLKRHCNYTYEKIKQFINNHHSTMVYALKLIDDIILIGQPIKDNIIINDLMKIYPQNEINIEVIIKKRKHKSQKEYQFKVYELGLLKKYEKEVKRIRKKYGII